jgi:hypothetical protein
MKLTRFLLFMILATMSLTSCNLIIGLRQTSPDGYVPNAVERWWMEQNSDQNSKL